MSWKSLLLIGLPALLISALIYGPGVSGPFIFDDQSSITKNSLLRITTLNSDSLVASAQSGHAGPLKRPIPMMSFALNYLWNGKYQASTFKITNIVIHAINGLLVFVLCRQLIQLLYKKSSTPRQRFIIAASISALWLVHPINLTSVLYIVQRMTSLSALFSLLCIIFYLSARQTHTEKNSTFKAILYSKSSFTCWVFALYSKENAAVIPLILLTIESIVFNNNFLLGYFKKATSGLKITFCLAACYLLYELFIFAYNGYGSRDFTMFERLLTQSRVLTFYVSLIFIPRLDAFGLFHDDILISTSLITPLTAIPSIAFITALLVSAFYFKHKNPLFSLGVLWFFIGHLIESTIIPLEMAHEHRNYLPSLGLILSAYSLVNLNKITDKKNLFAILSLCVLCSLTTATRAYQWGSFERLAFFEAKHHPQSAAAQALNSNINHKIGNIESAIESIKKAMLLAPEEATYTLHYQHMLTEIGQSVPPTLQNETLRRLNQHTLTPSTRGALMSISTCLTKESCKGIVSNYMAWLKLILTNHPDSSLFHYLYGKGFEAKGNSLQALNEFQKSHLLDKNYLDPLISMIIILIKNGQLRQAEEVLQWAEEKNKTVEIPHTEDLRKLREGITELMKSAPTNTTK